MPDLAITMTSDPPPGSLVGVTQITYTIDVTNLTDVFATNAKVVDFVPGNLSAVTATLVGGAPNACTGSGAITCFIGGLPGHATARIVISGNVISQFTYTSNSANVSALQPDPNMANNIAAITHF